MSRPDVSVVTSTYNAAEFVERALESVRGQTIDHERIEHVVVDDGSTDETVSIVKSFDAPYLRLVETGTNSGATETLNRGIEEARGTYVVALDADDEFLPELVERMVDVLDSNPKVDFVYSDYYEQDRDGERVVVDTGEDILRTITIGIMHRRGVIERFGLYDPEMRFSEYDLLLRYLDAGLEGYHIPVPLFVYHRRAGSQTTDAEWVRAGAEELKEKWGADVTIREY